MHLPVHSHVHAYGAHACVPIGMHLCMHSHVGGHGWSCVGVAVCVCVGRIVLGLVYVDACILFVVY